MGSIEVGAKTGSTSDCDHIRSGEDNSYSNDLYYDGNPFDGSYSQYTAGRLAAIQYSGGNCSSLGPPRAGCDTIQEMYSYNAGGAVVGKCVVLIRGSSTYPNLCGSWTYDTEGRMTAVTYPAWTDQYLGAAAPGPSYAYAYDTMGRLNTMTDQLASTTLISGVTYNVANKVQAISGSFFNETRSYNSLFQLAQITVPGALNIQYAYSSTMNNGKVASQTDVISGEQVVYTYDALNRLATAQTVTNPGVTQWGQSYNYDGFGNLTAQNVIKGSAPTMSVTYNAATNRQSGDTADANGNLGSGYVYDIVNRLLQASGTTMQYAYDSGNKRVWRGDGSTLDEIAFWGVNGQKLATYHPYYDYTLGALTFGMTFTDVYFGSRLIGKGTVSGFGVLTVASVATDRLGSIGKFYPYGQERPSATANDTEKFTGYYRDAATGLDYADQRYHQPGVGRFMTPDAASSTKMSDPGSWNRYAYTRGDPVNRNDANGTCDDDLGFLGVDPLPCDYGWGWYGPQDPAPADFACGGGWGVWTVLSSAGGSNWQCVLAQNAPVFYVPPPSCTIDVQYHAVSLNGTASNVALALGAPAHGYITFTTPTGTSYAEGFNDGGMLGAALGSTHLVNDTPSSDPSAGSITGPQVCDWITQIQSAVSAVNQADFPYSAFPGPNSNFVLGVMLLTLPDTSWFSVPPNLAVAGFPWEDF